MDNDMRARVVMVVEDNHDVQDLLRETLADEGYRVLVAETGEAALEHLANVQPDLITLDLNLPGISGAQLLTAIREQVDIEHVPVVIVSASIKIDNSLKKMAQAVVLKPFNLQELLDIIQKLIPLEK